MQDRVVSVKIAVNALLYNVGQDYRQTGVSRYVDRLLAHLAPHCREDDLTAIVANDSGKPTWPGVDLLTAPVASRSPASRIRWEQTVMPVRIRREGFACLHGTVNTLPLLPTGSSRVLTIHDLAFLRFPDHVTRKRYAYLWSMIRSSTRMADAIIVPSDSARHDVHDLLAVPFQQITVAPHGVDPHFQPAPPDVIAAARARFGLERPYLLTVGTIEPRKNLIRLIQAFAALAPQIEHDLVLVGPTGWLTDPIEAEIARTGLGDRIRRTGFADDAALIALYSGAASVVIPSIYEGFGLPVLEAMACGAVVVTANVSSLPEVTGDAAILVDPLDVDDIANGILASLTHERERTRLSRQAREQASTFTWDRAAAITAGVYHGVGR